LSTYHSITGALPPFTGVAVNVRVVDGQPLELMLTEGVTEGVTSTVTVLVAVQPLAVPVTVYVVVVVGLAVTVAPEVALSPSAGDQL
jgi:hypothetical protein